MRVLFLRIGPDVKPRGRNAWRCLGPRSRAVHSLLLFHRSASLASFVVEVLFFAERDPVVGFLRYQQN